MIAPRLPRGQVHVGEGERVVHDQDAGSLGLGDEEFVDSGQSKGMNEDQHVEIGIFQ